VPKKKKAKKKPYFGMEVQDAIVRYNDTDNTALKNKIYQEEIHKAFDKLCENIINTFKFTYFDYGFEDIKNETISFLVMNMHKYDHTKGSKAFSYFSVVAKNYLILHNNNNYKKMKSHDSIEVLDYTDDNSHSNFKHDSSGDDHFKSFLKHLVRYFDHNIPKMFKKKRDIDIAFAIVELLVKIDEIENYNKKALYLLIREMTGVNTNNITKIINVMKSHYKRALNEYNTTGIITLEKDSRKKFF
tara:strand:- start:370 stop:1101 length:732 start_codon:yes stop_codon:yes gene_type:complete